MSITKKLEPITTKKWNQRDVNSTKKADTNTHTQKKVKKMKGEPRTHTACMFVSCQMEQTVNIQRRQQPNKKKQTVKM